MLYDFVDVEVFDEVHVSVTSKSRLVENEETLRRRRGSIKSAGEKMRRGVGDDPSWATRELTCLVWLLVRQRNPLL